MGAAVGHLGVGERCARCDHSSAKHAVPGLDGECVTCTCRAFRAREQAVTVRTPVVARRALVGVPWVSVQVAEIEQERRRGQQGTPDRQGRRA
jgi:hypothetical protein